MREIILLLFLAGQTLCLQEGSTSLSRQTHKFPRFQRPLDTCQEENQACVAGDNLIRYVAEVEDVQLCKQLCTDTEGCYVVSYFGPRSFPFRNYCMLFRNCPHLHACSDCQSLHKHCFGSCTKDVEGAIVNNALDVAPDVKDEPQCLMSCKMNSECKLYTYYKASDRNYPKLCILQNDMEQPIQKCDQCKTGKPDCQKATTCQFFVGNSTNPLTVYKFTETTPVDVKVPISALLANCKLNVVAVGGGANYTNVVDGEGGGGSGYVASASVEVKFSTYQVIVGNVQQSSMVKSSTGATVIGARPGNRQDGYSGGGNGGSYQDRYDDGGHDGGDGKKFGGKGSGLDLSSITQLKTFHLSPGAGGQKHFERGRSAYEGKYYGGGGGGVLVDGEGPQSSRFAGQGYGGGNSQWSGEAGPGVILIEISDS